MRIYLKLFLLVLFPFTLISGALADETISIHPTNFFMLGKGKELFYPQAINADFLLAPGISKSQIDQALSGWAAMGANAVRICADSIHASDDPLNLYLENNGRIKEERLSRMDTLFDLAKQHEMHVILALFDVQRMCESWDSSPYNEANGGVAVSQEDWFSNATLLARALQRTGQLIERYQDRNILAWEIARGANVWDLQKRPRPRLMENVCFWTVRIANHIRQEDTQGHLIALSFLPNTFPHTLMGLPQINFHFIQISSKDALLTAQSMSPYISSIRKQFKKPVFVAEYQWKGNQNLRETFLYNMFWATFASGSSVFLTPVQKDRTFHVPDADLRLLQTLGHFLPEIQLDGVPRAVVAPAELSPKDTYIMAESIFGFDRIFWILQKNPAKNSATVSLNTIEGKYQMQWMDPSAGIKYPRHMFNQLRKSLILQPPEFERSLLGVLRLNKRAPQKQKPPVERPAVDGE